MTTCLSIRVRGTEVIEATGEIEETEEVRGRKAMIERMIEEETDRGEIGKIPSIAKTREAELETTEVSGSTTIQEIVAEGTTDSHTGKRTVITIATEIATATTATTTPENPIVRELTVRKKGSIITVTIRSVQPNWPQPMAT